MGILRFHLIRGNKVSITRLDVTGGLLAENSEDRREIIDESSARAARIAEDCIKACQFRRRKRSDRDAPKVAEAWRYQETPKSRSNEPKHIMHFRFTQHEFNCFRLWGEGLGFAHEKDPRLLRRIVREIGEGRIALVRFRDEEEYLDTLRGLNYVRKTFRRLRKPFSDAAAALCKSLGLLRRVQWLLTQGSDEMLPLTPWEVKSRLGYWRPKRNRPL